MVKRLPRTVKLKAPPMVGADIDAHARAMHRYLADGQLARYEQQPDVMRETFGVGKRTLAKKAALKAGLPQYGVVGPELYARMRNAGAYDRLCDHRLTQYVNETHRVELVFPIAFGHNVSVCQRRHITAGLPHNVAYDFCSEDGAAVLAVEDGEIIKLSGHPPWEDSWDSKGVYGWSVYLRTASGYVWYYTHLGVREPLRLGQRVAVGTLLGRVGDQRFRPDHIHLGVTSPAGEADALKRVDAASRAPRVRPIPAGVGG